MGQVQEKFLAPLLRIFSPQKTDDVAGWVDAYVQVLERFDDEVLAAGAMRVIETHKMRAFPLPAECVEACVIAKDAREAPDLTKPLTKERYPEWSDERRALANNLFASCKHSKNALAEDWALTLHDFLREQGRWPNDMEASKLRSKGISNSHKFWDMVGKDNPVENSCIRFDAGKFIAMRREKIAKLKQLFLVGSGYGH